MELYLHSPNTSSWRGAIYLQYVKRKREKFLVV